MSHTAKKLPFLNDVKKAAKQTINATFDVVNGYM